MTRFSDLPKVLPFARQKEAAGNSAPGLEAEVIELFDVLRDPVFRYILSFGLSSQDGEDIVQEVFLGLFQHLQQQKDRSNLRGWVFRVAHNLSLKRRMQNRRYTRPEGFEESLAAVRADPAPSAEENLLQGQRQGRLLAVLHALPELDQQCLRLRAEGLRYREIAEVLGIALGSVAASLAKSLDRLQRADRG